MGRVWVGLVPCGLATRYADHPDVMSQPHAAPPRRGRRRSSEPKDDEAGRQEVAALRSELHVREASSGLFACSALLEGLELLGGLLMAWAIGSGLNPLAHRKTAPVKGGGGLVGGTENQAFLRNRS